MANRCSTTWRIAKHDVVRANYFDCAKPQRGGPSPEADRESASDGLTTFRRACRSGAKNGPTFDSLKVSLLFSSAPAASWTAAYNGGTLYLPVTLQRTIITFDKWADGDTRARCATISRGTLETAAIVLPRRDSHASWISRPAYISPTLNNILREFKLKLRAAHSSPPRLLPRQISRRSLRF